MIITKEILKAVKSLRGGYTKAILALLGVSWPPQHGWPKRLIGHTIPDGIFIPDLINPGKLIINPDIGTLSKIANEESLKSHDATENEVLKIIAVERRKRRGQRRKEKEGKEYSYIIGALTTQFVKIGKTTNPIKHRLSALQTASPHKLVLLATTDEKEDKLHKRFRKYRVRGTEWFRWNDELKYFIECECHKDVG